MKLFKKAILIIHGFAGGVYDEEYLFYKLQVKNKYDVFNYTLPGHDGNFKERITADLWIKSSEEKIKFLIDNGYNKIYIIGHSMGGVIASYLASKYSEVKKLVLVSPAFRITGMEDGKLNLSTALLAPKKILEQYGFKLIKNRAFKLPTNCIIEFFHIMNKYQSIPSKVTIPTLIIRGTSDTIVPYSSVKYVYENVNTNYKKIVELKGISHDVFRENKKKQTTNLIIDFFNNKNNLLLMPKLIEADDK